MRENNSLGLTEGKTKSNVKKINQTNKRPNSPPPAPKSLKVKVLIWHDVKKERPDEGRTVLYKTTNDYFGVINNMHIAEDNRFNSIMWYECVSVNEYEGDEYPVISENQIKSWAYVD